jgi:NADH-quinone oxidoreductase subunit N
MDYSANLAMTLPEIVLSLGAIVLMLVSAWGGSASTRAVSWTAVAVLAGAGIALIGPASYGGSAFGGLYRADAFAAFAKILISSPLRCRSSSRRISSRSRPATICVPNIRC